MDLAYWMASFTFDLMRNFEAAISHFRVTGEIKMVLAYFCYPQKQGGEGIRKQILQIYCAYPFFICLVELILPFTNFFFVSHVTDLCLEF